MRIELRQRAEHSLILTQSMRQSLMVLQMALPELRDYVQEQALSNPLIELELGSDMVLLPGGSGPEAQSAQGDEPLVLHRGEDRGVRAPAQSGGQPFLEDLADQGESFTDMLCEQLSQFERQDPELVPLCEYLIHCLSENGYFEFELHDIARELGLPLFRVEQALYAVQSLVPTGVGARNLTECLVLQLAQTSSFNAHTLRLVQEGLSLLAADDLPGIARLTGCSRPQAEQAARAVRALSPIPSRGYAGGPRTQYQIPEADLRLEQNRLIIEMNRAFMPRLSLNAQTHGLLEQSGIPSDLAYLRQQTAAARELIHCVESRVGTLEALLTCIARRQMGFFARGEELVPMTMSQLAAELELSVSTVSRALQGKSIRFEGRTLELRALFSAPIATAQGGEISSGSVKRQIERFIKAENPAHPLSDEKLRLALGAVGLPISRRTVAKYREELGIPPSTRRRRA